MPEASSLVTTNMKHFKFFVGICLVFGVVLLWVGSNFLVHKIFADGEFNKAFFLTYFNTGTFSLFLVTSYIQRMFRKHFLKKPGKDDVELNTNGTSSEISKETIVENLSGKESPSQLTIKETARYSIIFCLFWFVANWTTNTSFVYTSVSSGTILSSTSGIFTLMLGTLFKVEKFTRWKLLGVLISIAGVSMIGVVDFGKDESKYSTSSMILGDFLALCGTFFYACYTTFFKLKVGDETRVDMQLFFGFVGLFNLIILFPLFFIFHYTGYEPFLWPPTSTVWGMILLNAFLGAFIPDMMWMYAVMMTSPLVVTLGLSLTNPLALIGEVVINGAKFTPLYIAGACLVVVGFLTVTRASFMESK